MTAYRKKERLIISIDREIESVCFIKSGMIISLSDGSFINFHNNLKIIDHNGVCAGSYDSSTTSANIMMSDIIGAKILSWKHDEDNDLTINLSSDFCLKLSIDESGLESLSATNPDGKVFTI